MNLVLWLIAPALVLDIAAGLKCALVAAMLATAAITCFVREGLPPAPLARLSRIP